MTGKRRKKEVKDNFDWLQPVPRPADVAAARQAYEDNYTFKEGFYTSDKSASQSKYSIPTNIMIRCANFTTYAIPMDHPLCNVEQTTNWLIKPAAHLLNRIHSATKRRSSLKGASLGQDLFICSAYISADKFVTSSDDIELIDFVHGDVAKKIWRTVREQISQRCFPRLALFAWDVAAKAWYASVVRAAFVYNRGDCSAIRGDRRGGSCVGMCIGSVVEVVGCTVGSGVGAGVVLCTGVAVMAGGVLACVCWPCIRGMVRNACGAVGAVDVDGLYGWWVCVPPFVLAVSPPFVMCGVGHGMLSGAPIIYCLMYFVEYCLSNGCR